MNKVTDSQMYSLLWYSAAQELVSAENLSRIFPDIERLQESSVFLSNLFSGFIPALVWTAFFA